MTIKNDQLPISPAFIIPVYYPGDSILMMMMIFHTDDDVALFFDLASD